MSRLREVDGKWQFEGGDGTWRTLVEPHGPPTDPQLHRLCEAGLIELVGGRPLTKLTAGQAIDELNAQEKPPDPGVRSGGS